MSKNLPAAPRLSRPPLERMLRIHEQLKNREYPNCSQLGHELEVATKTIQRDIEFMRDRLNLPIDFDFHQNGYLYTEPVANFPTVQVTEKELVAFCVAEKALAQYKGTPFEQPLHAAFQKLTQALSDKVSFGWNGTDSPISFKSVGTTVADLELFQAVSRAVLRSQELAFEYRKLRGAKPEQRLVQPYHLACIENQWYLFAFDLGRQQIRTFVLGRMRAVRATGKLFTRPAEFSLSRHLGHSFGVFSNDGKPQEIRIRFDAFAARLVRERTWHSSQKIKPLAGDRIEFVVRLGSLTEIERWVLSWGAHAQVLAPAALRDRVRAAATAILAQNP